MIFSNTHEENLILAFALILIILITLSLVFVYVDYSNRVKLFVSMIVLFEGLSILLQPNKLPRYYGFPLVIFGSYFSINYMYYLKPSDYQKNITTLTIRKLSLDGKLVPYFWVFGLILMLTVIFISYFFFNEYIGRTDRLLLLISLCWILYIYVPKEYGYERDFVFIFSNLLVFFLVLPNIFLGLTEGEVSIISSWTNSEALVNLLLAQPLGTVLNLLGYEVFVIKDTIAFIDLTTNQYQQVSIARGCSGIYSVAIFSAAYISYIMSENYEWNINTVLLLIIGLFASYMANIFRMVVIILAGHYWGKDALYWTHTNAGWIIFLFWIILFWKFINYILYSNDNAKG